MSFKKMYIESETRKTAQDLVEMYERIIRLRTEARLKGQKPPFENLSLLLARYLQANKLETKI